MSSARRGGVDTLTLLSGGAHDARVFSGVGDPEGVVVGNVGDIFLRVDGDGFAIYGKESLSGTTDGWVPQGTSNALSLFIQERAIELPNKADFGQIWIKDDVPNTLHFANDEGDSFPIANLNTVQRYTQQQYSGTKVITDALSASYQAAASNIFSLIATDAIGATRELQNPGLMAVGMSWQVQFQQSAGGGDALTFDTWYDFGDEGAPDFTTQAGGIKNIITCIAISLTQIATTVLKGFRAV